ncbi:MAG: acetyltransferase [Melioribacteraceae bacterium]|nr:acetyltransferase [Melioribacteraceae bacterium]
MENIIVIGGGGHAKVVISILKKLGNYNILGFTEIESSEPILGINNIGNDDFVIEKYSNTSTNNIALGIGQIKTHELRKNLVSKYMNAGFIFPTIISPNATINESVNIGNGTIVMDNVAINTCSNIGSYSIINTSSIIEHDCKIGNFVHIAPGVTLSGEVVIESNTFIGAGSTVANSVSVSENCIIGAGSLVRKNISQSGLYVGNPVKKYK